MIYKALDIHETKITHHFNDYRERKLKSSSGGKESHLYHHAYDILDYVKTTWDVTDSVPGMNY